MNSETHDRLSATTLWQKCWQTTKGTFPKTMYISLFTIILPEMLFEFFYAERAQQYVEKVHEFTTGRLGNGGSVDFFDLVNMASQYFSGYFLSGFFLSILYLSAYFAMVIHATEFSLGKPLSGFTSVLKQGFRYVVPRGFIALSLFAVLVLFAQMVLPPLEIVLLPGIMIPVLIVAEKCAAFAAVKQSLMITYGQTFPQGVVSLMFHLISLGAFFIASLLVVVYAADAFLNLDLVFNFKRNVWLAVVPHTSVTWITVFSLFFKTTAIAFLVQLLANFSTAVYFWVIALRSPLPRSGITA
jgi:hypothetical protein